jgi:hypothetical protein
MGVFWSFFGLRSERARAKMSTDTVGVFTEEVDIPEFNLRKAGR